MGHSPGQDFIYGFLVPEDFEGEIYDLAEELGLSYAFSGDAAYGTLNEQVVGFELDKWEVVDDGYLGGYHGNRFDLEYFNNWAKESKEKMTDELVKKIKETFGISDEEEPAIWTLSNAG